MYRPKLPDDMWGEFASTFKEWHYLVGGVAVGVIIVILLIIYTVLKVAKYISKPYSTFGSEG